MFERSIYSNAKQLLTSEGFFALTFELCSFKFMEFISAQKWVQFCGATLTSTETQQQEDWSDTG